MLPTTGASGSGGASRRDEAAIGDAAYPQSVLPQKAEPDQGARVTSPTREEKGAQPPAVAQLEQFLNNEKTIVKITPEEVDAYGAKLEGELLSLLPQKAGPGQGAPVTSSTCEEKGVPPPTVAIEDLEDFLHNEHPDLKVILEEADANPPEADANPPDLDEQQGAQPPAVTATEFAQLEQFLNNEKNEVKITPEEVDAYAAKLGAELLALAGNGKDQVQDIQGDDEHPNVQAPNIQLEGAMGLGQFIPELLDNLVQQRMWTDMVEYLKKGVAHHATHCMIPTPDGATHDNLVVVHAELFLSAHKTHVMELICEPDDGAARQYFNQNLAPLRDSVPEDRQWLRDRFSKLDQIVDRQLPLPNLEEIARESAMEIKDYMFLYFPELRPPVAPVRGKAQSTLWRYGEKVQQADGRKGVRCFSCHKVFWGMNIGRLRTHLQGGDAHQGRCPAVLLCILQSIADA